MDSWGLERLIAFGAERIAYVMEHGNLARAAESSYHGRYEVPAVMLWQRHIEHLLREAGMDAWRDLVTRVVGGR
ncbi:UNVERIFIED_ORG: hypothetical protein ABIB13_001164 [Arthrobacter sp. UYEF2]